MKRITYEAIAGSFVRPQDNYRAVNLKLDYDDSALVASYLPTQKSVSVLDAICASLVSTSRQRAISIVAPYGSGKSSLLLCCCSLLENRPACKAGVATVQRRIEQLSINTAKSIAPLLKKRKGYMAVILSGEEGALEAAFISGLKDAFRRHGLDSAWRSLKGEISKSNGSRGFAAISTYTAATEKLCALGFQGIVVIYDEFGKVLEAQQTNPRPADLFFLQTFAELCSRSGERPILLMLSMHQGFGQYAQRLPVHTRNEWAKIEGRFRTFHFVEDSLQVYELIGQTVGKLRANESDSTAKLIRHIVRPSARRAIEFAAFSPFERERRLEDLLFRVFPLDAAAMYALPRLSARVAQNERTLFHFLLGQEVECFYPVLIGRKNDPVPVVQVADLFDYFADAMSKDTGIGGVYRRYIEILAALERVDLKDDLARRVIKTIGILSVISEPGKLPPSGRVLQLALGALTNEQQKILRNTLESLLGKKVLLHRRHTDEYRIWEGSDVDLVSLLRHKKAEAEPHFDPVTFLSMKVSAPPILAHRYNEDFGIVRHFEGRFISTDDLRRMESWDKVFERRTECDGIVYYVVTESVQDIEQALILTGRAKDKHHALFAVPLSPLNLFEPLLELYCLEQLLGDSSFVSEDPVLRRELLELADDCLTVIQRRLLRFLEPRHSEATWIYEGQQRSEIVSQAVLRRFVSGVCAELFPLTPRFHNELVNRRRPSTTIVNARKKLLRAMLQNPEAENLGLSGHGPDVSIFRAVLLKHRIYKNQIPGRGSFARAEEINDPNTRRTISVIEEFLHESTDLPRPFSPLIDTLLLPPIGIRPGVIPLLIAAVVQAFPLPLNILEDGVYVRELKAELFERMLSAPEKVTVQCIKLGQAVDAYLSALPGVFGPVTAEPESARSQRRSLQLALESLYQWLHELPSCAMTTQSLSQSSLALRTTLVKATDPAALIFREIPQVYLPAKEFKTDSLELSSDEYGAILQALSESVKELSSYKTTLVERADRIVVKVFSPLAELPNSGTTHRVRSWLGELSKDIKEFLDDPQCAGFVTRAMSKYENDSMLVESLASLVTGRSISYWDDSFLRQFELGSLQIRKKITATDSLLRLRDGLEADGEQPTMKALDRPDVVKRLIRGNYGLPERLLTVKGNIGSVLGEHLKGLSREERAGILMALLREEL